MAELKTKPSQKSVKEFLDSIENEKRRKDARAIDKIMQEVTGEKGIMWGPSIVGYDSYHYKYDSGQEGDWMAVGFSPRKQSLVLYIMSGFKRYNELMKNLGKYKTGKSCLYVNTLEDVDEKILRELIRESVDFIKEYYADK